MKKIFTLVLPLTVVAASLSYANANAAETTPAPATATAAAAAAPQAAQAPHALTRRDVYNELVQAQKDGSLARMDKIYFAG